MTRPTPIRFPVSTYSMSLALLEAIGYWETGDAGIGEDAHTALKLFYATDGTARTVPVYEVRSGTRISAAVLPLPAAATAPPAAALSIQTLPLHHPLSVDLTHTLPPAADLPMPVSLRPSLSGRMLAAVQAGQAPLPRPHRPRLLVLEELDQGLHAAPLPCPRGDAGVGSAPVGRRCAPHRLPLGPRSHRAAPWARALPQNLAARLDRAPTRLARAASPILRPRLPWTTHPQILACAAPPPLQP
eukprot:7378541-Prymnesium_polylepis.2